MNRAREYGEYTCQLEADTLKGWHPPYMPPVLIAHKIRPKTPAEQQFLKNIQDRAQTPDHTAEDRFFSTVAGWIVTNRQFEDALALDGADSWVANKIAAGDASIVAWSKHYATTYKVDAEAVIQSASAAVANAFGYFPSDAIAGGEAP